MISTTVYQNLPIRLGQLRLLRLSKPDTQFVCTLSVHSLSDADVDNEFFAISYEWGPKPDNDTMQTIMLNGIGFSVSPTLVATMDEVYNILGDPKDSKYIWIDFICLNQGDRAEQDQQIPGMRAIYRKAKHVLGFLGPNIDPQMSDGPLVAHHTLYGAMTQIITTSNSVGLAPRPLTQEGLRGVIRVPAIDDSPAWISIQRFLARSYFRRVWIWQEMVLAKNLILIGGGIHLNWNVLQTFLEAIRVFGRVPLIQDYARLLERRSVLSIFSHVERHRQAYDEGRGVGQDLPGLLQSLRELDVGKFKVDRIWGSMALWHQGLADAIDQLIPDKKSVRYEETYLQLARFYIPRDGSLLFLNLAASTHKHPTLPSWCPDWDTTMAYENFGTGAGFEAGFRSSMEDRQPQITLDADPQRIHVPGRLVDTVDVVVAGCWSFDDQLDARQGSSGVLLSWLQACLAACRQADASNALPDQFCRTLITNCVKQRTIKVPVDQDVRGTFQNWYLQLRNYSKGNVAFTVEEAQQAAVEEYRLAVQTACQGRVFFMTNRGRAGIGPPDMKTGDVVASFTSSASLFVLREGQNGSCLIGDAWVYGLMTLEETIAASEQASCTFLLR